MAHATAARAPDGVTAHIDVSRVSKAFERHGKVVRALDDVSFAVPTGRVLAIVGPSGCGKTTLVNIIAGFERPDAGTVSALGRPVTGPSASRAVVPQHYALFDWKTVRGNVEFALKAKGISRGERRALATDHLERVGLASVAELYPAELSGGMKQRLAVARALAVEPPCLLLDEPLAALDYQLRLRLQNELTAMLERARQTAVVVTHDVDEALYLADEVLLMTGSPGTIDSVVRVSLPRPREPYMRNMPEFAELRQVIWDALGLVEARQPQQEGITPACAS